MALGRLFIISAPSGAGKTTLAKRLVEEMKDITLSVSHTTRLMRVGEKHGVDYLFVGRDEFEAMVQNEEFIEYAEVFGNLYGTSKSMVRGLQNKGMNVLLDIDWQGARKVRLQQPDIPSIFILPPSKQELERRLRGRGQDSDDVIAHRMQEAAEEMSHHNEYDYVVINDDLESALKDLKAIVSGSTERKRVI